MSRDAKYKTIILAINANNDKYHYELKYLLYYIGMYKYKYYYVI